MAGLLKGGKSDDLQKQSGTRFIHKYIQASSNVFEENRLLKFAMLAMLAMFTIVSMVVYSAAQNQRTVVVPVGGGGDLYVVGGSVSPDYLRSMVYLIVGLSGNYNSYSANQQFQELLRLAHPSKFQELRTVYSDVLSELKRNPTLSISTFLRPEKSISYDSHRIVVPVERQRVIGGFVRKFRGNIVIGYTVENGRFWITSIRDEEFGDAE